MIASTSSGDPWPGGYWLRPASIASCTCSITAPGPLRSGKPWPRLTEPVRTASADISAKIVLPTPSRRRAARLPGAAVTGPVSVPDVGMLTPAT